MFAPNRRLPGQRSTRPAPTIDRGTSSLQPTRLRRSTSRLFHMKRKPGSIATSHCCGSGRPRPTSSRPRHCRTSGPGTSPTLFSSSLSPHRPNVGPTSAAVAAFPGSSWPAPWPGRPGRASIWSSESPRRRPSCAKPCASRHLRESYISLRSGIMWIESPAPVDCVTARALAPLHQLIGFAEPLMRRGAKALFLKGQDVESELTEATKYWNIQPQLHHSRTGDGWIVELASVERRG
ncbi:hypothetical protein ACVWZK_001054 [Bradyrhizobium sp. GM0.4]